MHALLLTVLALGAPLDTATFAGGCFWSMEHPFDQLDGVVSVTVGYMGGRTSHPSYEDVSSGETGHLESVQVVYDPRRVTYEKLLDAFWHNIDPLTADGQFCDHGPQYQTAVFYRSASQRRLAEDSKVQVARRFRRPAVQLARQVRVGHRVAQLHEAAGAREHPPENRPLFVHGAHRGPFRPRGLAPRPSLRRRAGADRLALLHQLRRAAVRPGRQP